MKLVIPFFHTKFDALQVSSKRLGEISPFGDSGDFWWLLWLRFPTYELVLYHSEIVRVSGFQKYKTHCSAIETQ